jgi:hypothetical protein
MTLPQEGYCRWCVSQTRQGEGHNCRDWVSEAAHLFPDYEPPVQPPETPVREAVVVEPVAWSHYPLAMYDARRKRFWFVMSLPCEPCGVWPEWSRVGEELYPVTQVQVAQSKTRRCIVGKHLNWFLAEYELFRGEWEQTASKPLYLSTRDEAIERAEAAIRQQGE